MAAADPTDPYSGQGVYVNPSMQGQGAGLGALYQKYYGTSTPSASDYDANLGNPGGLSAVEAMMKADPNNILNKPPAAAPAAPAAPPPTSSTMPVSSAPPQIYTSPGIATPTPAPSVAPANNSPFLDALQGALTNQISTLSDPNQAGVNSPWVQPAIAANHVATARGLEGTNANIAEQMAAEGLGHSGAMDVAKQRAAEDASSSEANFAGGAVQNQSGLNLGALTNLLGVGGGQLTSANSTLTQQQGLANQLAEANGQLGLGYGQLNNSAVQGNNSLGYNYAALMALMNQQGYSAAASGGA